MFSENLEDFLMNSSMGIHCVSPDGVVLYANQCELETLGYTEEEYVGHHVSEFQMDKDALDDMMERLGRFESLKNYPAKVQGKDGTKYLLYNSSVYHDGDKFIHTRCFAIDVDKHTYDAFKRDLVPAAENPPSRRPGGPDTATI